MAYWGEYVPVAERRARAKKKLEKLRKQSKNIQPVEIEGRKIGHSFWGKGWCDHLESFSDYENRLPRGRTYVRNGSVCHLDIQPGRIEAMVSGSSLYNVTIRIKKLKPAIWTHIKERCSGQIGSMLELLQGRLSGEVMAVVSDHANGLFPKPREIELSCSCPDWAVMCKHVAAALYGVGNRLDTRPELLFLLRNVDAEELIATEMAIPEAVDVSADAIAEDALGDIFGIDLDSESEADATPEPKTKSKRRPRQTKVPKKKAKGTSATKTASMQPAKDKPPAIRPTGKSVARLRKHLRLTVPEFADTLGVTPASIYRWESTQGRIKLQGRSLKALDALHRETKKR